MFRINFCYAQTESDSLLQIVENYSEEDTIKVMMLLDLANSYWRSSPEDSEMYGKRGLALAEKLNYKLGVARAYVIITNALISKGDLEKSMKYAHLTLQKSKEARFALGEGHAYKFMGSIYLDQGHVEEAKKYFEEAIAVYTRLKHEKHIGNTLLNLASIYSAKNDLDSALFYYDKVRSMEYVKNYRLLLGVIHNNMGLILAEKGVLNEAITSYLEALEIRRAAGDQMGEIITLENLGNAYRNKKDFLLAEQHLLSALRLAEELNLIRDRVFLYKDLVALEKARGNYEKALNYYDKYTLFNDSLLNEAKNRQIAELQTRYETEKKEKEIASLQLDIQTKAFWQKIYAAGVLLLALVAFFIFLFYRYRNRLNRRLLQAQQNQTHQLQEIDHMKSCFFANISHEFRTPLTLILDPIDALKQEVKEETAKKQLQVIQRSALRLLKLINQLLSLSKIEAGKLELKASPQNVVPFLRGLFYSFHSLAGKKKILMDFESPEEEILLFFDTEKVAQIINNLLSNAFTFTETHGKITLGLQRTTWNDIPCLEIMVKDTGRGISKDQLPYIFDRFFQADTSDTKANEGTGIGLALAKELAMLHKGNITVESEKGKGSTFYVYLPLGKAHLREEQLMIMPAENLIAPEQTPVEIQDTLSAPSPTEDNHEKPLILVVEDHPDLQDYIRSILSAECQILQAENGKEGLEKALSHAPHLIISDVMMPQMNGIVLCKQLKNDIRTSHIPIILLTAKNTEEDKLTGLKSEADDYLTKPFSTRELKMRIKNLITLRQKLQEKFKGSMIIKPKDIEVSSMEQVFLEKLMHLLEEYLPNEGFGVEQLSEEMGMSRVHLHRKLQALTNHSPSQFIRRFRLQRAMDLLQKNAGTVAEIAYNVGFSSPTYFTKCFTEQYGYPPKEAKAHPTL